MFGKPQTWTAADAQARDEFVTTMLKLCKKRPPKLINIDSRLTKASNCTFSMDAARGWEAMNADGYFLHNQTT